MSRIFSYQTFKHLIYALVLLNVYLFLKENIASAHHSLASGFGFSDILAVFTESIDTIAWFILLIIFELETYVIPDDKLKGKTQWLLTAVKLVCYSFIIQAFIGFSTRLYELFQVAPLSQSLCQLSGLNYSIMTNLNEYAEVTMGNCQHVPEQGLLVLSLFDNIVVHSNNLLAIQRLAFVDVLNSAAWLLVVFILEMDVWLQLKGIFKGRVVFVSKVSKFVLYSTLFLAAVYWGLYGGWLDFWDACLWLIAFIFIEMNLFEWTQEPQQKQSLL